MAQAVHGPLSFLNSDGRAHPRENALALATLVLGLVALVTAFFPGLHLLASWTGLAGIVVGAWAQLVSATTVRKRSAVVAETSCAHAPTTLPARPVQEASRRSPGKKPVTRATRPRTRVARPRACSRGCALPSELRTQSGSCTACATLNIPA